jgi:2-dehydro-3-deoxy-L-rhamnonate dehydrogenase (NAD+)
MVETRSEPVAIVTGGAGGLGWAIARRLHADGMVVALADIDEAAAAGRAAELEGAMGLDVDVSNPEGATRMIATVVDRWGRLDVLVNNAGVAGPTAPVADYPLDAWRRVLAVNLDGVSTAPGRRSRTCCAGVAAASSTWPP